MLALPNKKNEMHTGKQAGATWSKASNEEPEGDMGEVGEAVVAGDDKEMIPVIRRRMRRATTKKAVGGNDNDDIRNDAAKTGGVSSPTNQPPTLKLLGLSPHGQTFPCSMCTFTCNLSCLVLFVSSSCFASRATSITRT